MKDNVCIMIFYVRLIWDERPKKLFHVKIEGSGSIWSSLPIICRLIIKKEKGKKRENTTILMKNESNQHLKENV